MQTNSRPVVAGGLRFQYLRVLRFQHYWASGDDAPALGQVLAAAREALTFEQAKSRLGPDARVHQMVFSAALSHEEDHDGGPDEVWVPVVRITDLEAGVLYDVELVGEGDALTACSYSCTVADEGSLDGADVMSRQQAIGLAKRFHRGELPAFTPGSRRTDLPAGQRYRRPELAKVAEVYREGEAARARRGERMSVRRYVADVFGAASVQTVDGWIRAARDAGLIDPATTGRGHTAPRKDDDRA